MTPKTVKYMRALYAQLIMTGKTYSSKILKAPLTHVQTLLLSMTRNKDLTTLLTSAAMKLFPSVEPCAPRLLMQQRSTSLTKSMEGVRGREMSHLSLSVLKCTAA